MSKPIITISESPKNVFTVSRLNQEARLLLEGHFPSIWLEGEISNLACPSSGHLYFSLKDSRSQVRCAYFRNRNRMTDSKIKDGMHVLVKATVSLYEGRGDYQLIIDYLEETGDGALRRAFEELKKKLELEGLFAAQTKKSFPVIPQQIGVVTSATGAAIKDILQVLNRRFPLTPIILYPSQVQGKQSAPFIVRSIESANQHAECDVLLIGRGGGSLEDLWGFNEESVARAIFNSTIPIVTGIGHEIDFTIADFVADHRAPTPSAAAAFLVPDQREYQSQLSNFLNDLQDAVLALFTQLNQQLKWLTQRLQHPGRRIEQQMQQCDALLHRLTRAIHHDLQQKTAKYNQLSAKLLRFSPHNYLNLCGSELQNLTGRLHNAIYLNLQQETKRFEYLAHGLDTVSPLATLCRGYAIVTNEDGQIVRHANYVQPGEKITARLGEGALYCTVNKVIK